LGQASARLTWGFDELQRHRFGRRAETLPEDQLLLALEEVEQVEAAGEAAVEKAPAERVVDVASRICPCCAGALHPIGEDVAERLDIVPTQFRVLVVRRPRYACRTCEAVVQAPAPARLIEGGLPTEATVAQVLVSKYADHLPLYRQAQIYARQGVALDRSTLADWVGRAAFLLRPVHARLLEQLKTSGKLFADETTAPVFDPGRGRTKTGQLFAYARDDRSWGGADPPGVAYVYAPDRKAERPLAHLAGFKGVLQVDGYGGYKLLAGRGEVRLAFCWAHVRRRFYELASAGPAPIAAEALARLAALYRIEGDLRGRSAEERQARSRPLLEAFEPWLRAPARADQPEERARRGDPLRPIPLVGAEPVPRGRPHRDRQQRSRANHPPARAQSQERPVRRLRWRRGALGRGRFADRDLQARRRRAPRLSRRRDRPHRRRPSQQPSRRAVALGLSDDACPQGRGLRTPLTPISVARNDDDADAGRGEPDAVECRAGSHR